jgi:hypothetical protein
MLVEELDEHGEVGQGSGQAIDLVDHDHIDAAGPDLGQEPLEGGPLHRSAGEAAVVVAGRKTAPALIGLALDVGLGRLALVVERVELLLEAVLGRDPGVDRAAQGWRGGPRHGNGLARSRRPKKRGPFQFVPVMARATCERLS